VAHFPTVLGAVAVDVIDRQVRRGGAAGARAAVVPEDHVALAVTAPLGAGPAAFPVPLRVGSAVTLPAFLPSRSHAQTLPLLCHGRL
jgi:hypothetical protein